MILFSQYHVKRKTDGLLYMIEAEGPVQVRLTFFDPGPVLLSADIDCSRYIGMDIISFGGISKENFKNYVDKLAKILYKIRRAKNGNIVGPYRRF